MDLKINEIIEIFTLTPNKVSQNQTIHRISTDTRTLQSGDLFIALVGEHFDGHLFIEEAFKKGAIACVVSVDIACEHLLLQTTDTHQFLLDLSEYYLRKRSVPVVAVSGSAGKTSTKEMIASVLRKKYLVHTNIANYNNEIGVPLTILSMPEKCDILVLEMGMNRKGELKNLSRVSKPDICVLTNVSVTHIENFNSMEEVLKAKCELFSHMKHDALVILNYDDDLLKNLEGKYKHEILFGLSDKSDVYALNINFHGLEGVQFQLHAGLESLCVCMKHPGKHTVYNALAASAVALSFNFQLSEIKEALEEFTSPKQRLTIENLENGICLINDCYNSSPISAEAAIDILDHASGRKIAILGEMLELGKYSNYYHKKVASYVMKSSVCVLICIGEKNKVMADVFKRSDKEFYYYDTQEEFFAHIHTILKKGDTVLVKGSRSTHMEKTVGKLYEVNL